MSGSVRTPKVPCPGCKTLLSGAGAPFVPGTPTPKPGDPSVCAYCGALLVFTDALGLALLDDQALLCMPYELLGDLKRAQAAVFRRLAQS